MSQVPVWLDKATLKKMRRQDLFVAAVAECVNKGIPRTSENIAEVTGLSVAQVVNINRTMDMKAYTDTLKPEVLEALVAMMNAAKKGDQRAMRNVIDIYGLDETNRTQEKRTGKTYAFDDGAAHDSD